ncbi:HTH-type transcriptional regulator UlaR [Reinekea marina]|uniref:HTH-type transcriptional regulator UlaR n=1 Tax=Reinekea marina TaxID=1310421 RepID=A0ABV7WRY7_9GAMM|nr:HTH-type transcriptional regulator UlaR [Reinekea marina]MDN3647615.1 HTH-type transcriptional regulator UlaR [Reinekea marina]
MSSRSRHRKLVEYVQEHTVATVSDLVEELETSPATVRRDITELDRQGLIKKIRNGAEKILSPRESKSSGISKLYPNISDYSDFSESERIAKAAVHICQDKDNIFIGEGQTTFLMGKYLLNENIHVYTNYLPLITYLITEDFPHLVVLGGQYIKSQNLLVSAEKNMSYQGRYLFVSGDGLTDGGLTKSALLAFMEEKKMLAYADKVIALVDSDKIGVFGGMSLFGLDELDMVITGRGADPTILDLLKRHHVAVILV